MAGESFTPSPVYATISPFAWKALTINNLWAGVVRTNMTFFLHHSISVYSFYNLVNWGFSSKVFILSPLMTRFYGFRVKLIAYYEIKVSGSVLNKPIYLAIAIDVEA